MVKKSFFSFILFFSYAFCVSLDDVVQNLIGNESYQVNQNFIKRLFLKKEKFFFDKNQEKMNYYEITKVLKDNGLLPLGFRTPIEMKLGFKAKTKPIFLTRLISGVLSSIGYSYFTIAKAKYSQDYVYLTFSLMTEHIVDPVVLLGELRKRGIVALDVARQDLRDWFYELDLQNASVMNAIFLKNEDRLELKNISGEYWFRVKQAGVISIVKKNPKIGWSPRIVLYDKELQILEIRTQNDFSASAEISVTDDTAFVMVTDLNNPARLKNGIVITFFSFNKK